ncbi:hypothetical protein G7046_g7368 [Stylonectria norvegica]|nr:hypothetical protein G7046_g7368 [Stylonectria norvegica]
MDVVRAGGVRVGSGKILPLKAKRASSQTRAEPSRFDEFRTGNLHFHAVLNCGAGTADIREQPRVIWSRPVRPPRTRRRPSKASQVLGDPAEIPEYHALIWNTARISSMLDESSVVSNFNRNEVMRAGSGEAWQPGQSQPPPWGSSADRREPRPRARRDRTSEPLGVDQAGLGLPGQATQLPTSVRPSAGAVSRVTSPAPGQRKPRMEAGNTSVQWMGPTAGSGRLQQGAGAHLSDRGSKAGSRAGSWSPELKGSTAQGLEGIQAVPPTLSHPAPPAASPPASSGAGEPPRNESVQSLKPEAGFGQPWTRLTQPRWPLVVVSVNYSQRLMLTNSLACWGWFLAGSQSQHGMDQYHGYGFRFLLPSSEAAHAGALVGLADYQYGKRLPAAVLPVRRLKLQNATRVAM